MHCYNEHASWEWACQSRGLHCPGYHHVSSVIEKEFLLVRGENSITLLACMLWTVKRLCRILLLPLNKPTSKEKQCCYLKDRQMLKLHIISSRCLNLKTASSVGQLKCFPLVKSDILAIVHKRHSKHTKIGKRFCSVSSVTGRSGEDD